MTFGPPRRLPKTMIGLVLPLVAAVAFPRLASANVITDWDQKAVGFVPPSSEGEREMAMVHAAMFDAVNSIAPKYRPFTTRVIASNGASQEAAAASAAAAVLVKVLPARSADVTAALAEYLATLPDGPAKAEGKRIGEAAAAKVTDARANDGSAAPDAYRPRTAPGVYIGTAPTVGSQWAKIKPFVLASSSQFRPVAPPSLTSEQWASDYNEVKDFGGKASTKRSPDQTEAAQFWLMIGPPAYHPLARQLAVAKRLDVVDSARLFALYSMALTDGYIAVFDAKYTYEWWRPVTAIRNGDVDGNPATVRDAAWQPLDITPAHPEYPCAHCVQSGAAAAVLQAVSGSNDIPEVTMTSTMAPGVTHRFSSLRAFTDEVANARIWAGFHYRSSAVVGTALGRSIGDYVVKSVLRPL